MHENSASEELAPSYLQFRMQKTRHHILDTTLSLLISEGILGLRIQSVTDATGVSSSVIYREFKSRHGLIVAATLKGYSDIRSKLLHHIQTMPLLACTMRPGDPIFADDPSFYEEFDQMAKYLCILIAVARHLTKAERLEVASVRGALVTQGLSVLTERCSLAGPVHACDADAFITALRIHILKTIGFQIA
jgi:AcrR family transcriptional regulator